MRDPRCHGRQFEESDADKFDSIIRKFGTRFPLTAAFSQHARLTLLEVRAEDAMYRRLEIRVVAEPLAEGFTATQGVDVDGFIRFSLGVQNRRKLRMGHYLETRFATIFNCYALPCERGALTEHGQKPDPLFPNAAVYAAAPAGDA